jgi:ABC-2 type transport system permease protein
MRALSIAWKDTRHVYRSIAGLAMMLVAPLLLAAALGAAFGAGDNFTVPAVKTAVVDLDGGAGAGTPAAGATLTGTLSSPALADLVVVTRFETPEAARAAVDHGDADVAVIVPPGLSKALMGTNSSVAEVQIYKDPALNVGPAIVTAVVQSVVQSLNGTRAAALTAAQLGASLGVTDTAELTDVASKAAEAFGRKIQTEAPITVEERPPVTPGAEARRRPNVASQVLVGMMLFFMLFGAATPARSILDEHRQGTLSRLFTTPTPRSLILGGKYIAVFLVVLVQSTILLLAGWLLLGAHWGELGPVIVLTLCGALVASSLGLLTVSFARTPGQAGAMSAAIFVFLGLISGNFVGTADVGGTFALVRRVSPLGWLLEGWGHVLFGGSWGSIALPVVVVLAFTLVFFALATFFFRRRYT